MPSALHRLPTAALLCFAGLQAERAGAQEVLDARVVLPLEARPLEAAVMRCAGAARAVIALDDGRLLELRPGWPAEPPREAARVPGFPRALLAIDDQLFVACDRPAALHRLSADGDRAPLALVSSASLAFSPRALARDRGEAFAGLVVGGEHEASAFRARAAELIVEPPHAIPCESPRAALLLHGARWLYVSARERSLVVHERGHENGQETSEMQRCDGIPRRVLELDDQRYAVLCGTPLGGDRIEIFSRASKKLEPIARYDSAGPVCLDACAADFDGDELLDLAVLNAGHGQLELRAGRRDGTFGPPHTFAVGQVPRRVIAWDADGDGRPGWLVLETAARRLNAIENRGGREAGPAHFRTPAGPTAVALEERAGAGPIAWVLCESEPGVLRLDGEARAFTSMPGRSLVSPALLPAAERRLWVYDLARHELLAFDGAARFSIAIALPLEQPLGPLPCGGRIALGERGSPLVRLVDPQTGAIEARALPFDVQSLVRGASGACWVAGVAGELHDLDVQRTLEARLPSGDVLACHGGDALPLFALVRDRQLYVARPGAAETFVAALSAPPAQIELVEIDGTLCFGALCPLAHTLETGRCAERSPVLRFGIGLGARSLAREKGGAPAWWIASTFSDELLRAAPR